MNTYTERYVAAVTRAVPPDARDDVAAELGASIADQIEARTAQGDAQLDAERTVLTELGDPLVLAANYAERPQWVVGPRFYTAWWRLLRLLLWIIMPFAAVGVALATALTGGDIGEMIAAAVVGVLNVGVHMVFWTTLMFFILERSGTGASALPQWDLDQLSESAAPGAGASDLIASVVTCLVFAGVVLWDLLIGWGGEQVQVLAPSLWPGAVLGLFVVLIITVVLAVVVFRAKRWTMPLAIVNAVLSLGVPAAAIVLLATGSLLHPDSSARFTDTPAPVLTVIGVVLALVFAGIGIASTVSAFRKAISSRARTVPVQNGKEDRGI